MYRHLSGRLRELGIRQGDLGEILGINAGNVSRRFTGITPWTVDEMYKVLEVCRAPSDELHIYFPPQIKS